MAAQTTISELHRHEDADVSLRGWLYGKRSGGKIVFLQLRDGTGICQCVVEAANTEAFSAAEALPQESSLVLTGRVRKDNRAAGGYEIAVRDLYALHPAQEYPITRKSHGIDFLMSQRHLWLRSRRPTAIMRIRHTLCKACRDFFDSHGFTLIDTPILTAGAGEDAQTLFPVEYFDRKAFLAQTGQLYLESACMALGRVYCFGPTFRAEKSKTRRHLTEFWMVEPEIAFADLDEVIAVAEDLVCCLVQAVLEKHEGDLTFLGRDPEPLRRIAKPFSRITYTEAAEMLRSPAIGEKLREELERDRQTLQTMANELPELEKQLEAAHKVWQQEKLRMRVQELREAVCEWEQDLQNRPDHIASAQNFQWGSDLGGSDETILARQFDQPVFVTDYPAEVKAFYMKQSPTDSRLVRNVDLLAPDGYGEIIGGSQREDDLTALESAMRRKGLRPEDYSWYLDLRRYGSVPHGGFGLGIERTLTWICGLKHVRETIPFPRTIGRLEP